MLLISRSASLALPEPELVILIVFLLSEVREKNAEGRNENAEVRGIVT